MAAQLAPDARQHLPPIALQVNAQAAARILAEQAGVDLGEGGKKRKGGAGAAGGPSLLEDDRFKAMFEDPEFAIDERSAEWKLLHPNTGGWRYGSGRQGRRERLGTPRVVRSTCTGWATRGVLHWG